MDKYASLTPIALAILKDKKTEAPESGKYNQYKKQGTYLCAGCGLALFRASSQFTSGCGWPSFDDEIEGAIGRKIDADGRRTEILCIRCEGHLGHVFMGERFTNKNLRHCVNSLSVDFVENQTVLDTEEAILAAGCFWGVDHYLKRLPGVLKTEVGYIGGRTKYPSYRDICEKDTGHIEAVRVIYDISLLNYERLIKYFFEIHDPTQTDGQGPDLGEQYLSAIFSFNEEQTLTAKKIIGILEGHDLKVATQIRSVSTFWIGEEYHQNYYEKHDKQPYCHQYTKRFD
jgi:peptide methionine sulfoxide reductase msrA/msrB